MKVMKRILCFAVAIAMISAAFQNTTEAATKVKLNKKKVTLTITKNKKKPSVTLKVKGAPKKAKKKAKWSTSNKSVAIVKKGKVTAKGAGKAIIGCKVKGKKYTCKVTVVDKRASLGVYIKTVVDRSYWQQYAKPAEITYNNKGEESSAISGEGAGRNICTNIVVITYKGKDVTNKAKIRLRRSANKPVAEIIKNGILTKSGEMMSRIGDYILTATYKGMEKTVRIKATTATHSYCQCCCGFAGDNDEYDKHCDTYVKTGTGCSRALAHFLLIPYYETYVKIVS